MQESEEMEVMRTCGYIPTKSITRRGINGEFMTIESATSGKKYGARVFYEMDFDELRDVNIAFSIEHPNVVHGTRMLTTRTCEDLYGMFCYLTEPPLATFAERKGGMTLKERMSVLLDVCDGISYLHSVGIVHRNIRPESVLIYSDRAAIGFCELSVYTYNNLHISTLDPGDYPPPETSLRNKEGVYTEPFTSNDATDIWGMGLMAAYTFSDDGLHCLAEFRQDKDGALDSVIASNLKDDRLRREVVKEIMKLRAKGVTDELFNELVELISLTLDYDPEYRIDFIEFSNQLRAIAEKHVEGENQRLEKKGRMVVPLVKQIPIHPLAISVVVDCLTRKMFKHTTLEQAFLTIDLYYRAVPYYDQLTGKNEYDVRNYTYLFFVCLMIAENLAPGVRHAVIADITSFTGSTVNNKLERLIETTRDGIIEMFNGILYRRYLFHTCKTEEALVAAFKELENPDYLMLDIEKWGKEHTPDPRRSVPFVNVILLKDFAKRL